MVNFDEAMLDIAIKKAWEYQTLALPNPSVGALVLGENNEILALEAHTRSGEAHAELKACKEAFKKLAQCPIALDTLSPKELFDFLCTHHNGVFEKCSFYITLEPCNHCGKTPPCSSLLAKLKPQKVVFGSWDKGQDSQGGAERLRKEGIEVVCGVREQECNALLYPFFSLHQKGHFNLFKLAQRLDGSYTNGAISSPLSQTFTHSQRGVADSLILSGKTIRNDSPKLDTRKAMQGYHKENLPIKILTRQKMQPKDCLSVCSKNIVITQNIQDLGLESGFNLIEGGYPLLQSLKDKIDCVLLILAMQTYQAHFSSFAWEFSLLHSHIFSSKQRKDIWLWLKP